MLERPIARFDDLRAPDGPALVFGDPVEVIEARTPGAVLPALECLQRRVTAGSWAAGYISYDAAPGIDPALTVVSRPPGDPFDELPLVWFGIFGAPTESTVESTSEPGEHPGLDAWRPSVSRERYDRAIASIRDLIGRGETYQVNYTLRLRTALAADPETFYAELCTAQRASYCAYLHVGRYRILSASPELFFETEGDRITTRPMKGTIRRGLREADDEELRNSLATSAKDHAENAMIVDLLRNDVGRIAAPGSFRYPSLFRLEPYESVWQMTSTVTASIPAERSFPDVIRALFPSGSVTGAPKVRTMEIIRELEDSPRGIYTGAIGYLAPVSPDGWRARFNVAIRTVSLDTASGIAEYGVGGGITWDSTAGSEYDEVVAKANVLTLRRPTFELLETIRFEAGSGFRYLDEHLSRLAASARYFGFTLDRPAVVHSLERAVDGVADGCVVRCALERSGTSTVTLRNLPATTSECAYHKTSWRLPYEEAARRHPDADDVVLVNRLGHVTETTIGNLAVKLDGGWWTPQLEDGLVPGIERAKALERGALRERSLTVEEVQGSEDLAVINSVRGWRPAMLLADD
jgi:para-aminobenzoate synthetase/4-amino-4-deoxychorismate lyase